MEVATFVQTPVAVAPVCPGKAAILGRPLRPHDTARVDHQRNQSRHEGNPYVRRLLCEFAHAASRTESTFKAKFQGLLVRRGRKRAIVAIAHKLLRTIFFMLKCGQHYRDTTVNDEEMSVKRNAARWIKKLTEFGFLPKPA